jgi:hypothetical protein
LRNIDALLGDRELMVATVGLLLAHNLPIVSTLTAPIALLGTWLHELCHAVMALLLGGSVRRISIYGDGSGLAETIIPDRRLARAMVAGAGYPGAAAIGALLLAARHTTFAGQTGLYTLGGAAALTALLWVRNLFGFVALSTLAGMLAAAGRWLTPASAHLAFTVVALSVSLHAFGSIGALFGSEQRAGGRPIASDATALSRLLWIPALAWSSAWAAWSLWVTWLALMSPFRA